MPNHCENQLYCETANFNSIIEPFKSKDENGHDFLDFEKIIPIPNDLKIECCHGSKDEELKEKYKSNLKKHGFENWYDFSLNKWGTKWNSYNCDFNEEGMRFSTAWSPPEAVIQELANKTGETFVLEYIEEGIGFCGRYTAIPNDGGIEQTYSIPDAPQELKDALGYEEHQEEYADAI